MNNNSQQLIVVPYDEEVDKVARDLFIAMIEGAKSSIDLMMY